MYEAPEIVYEGDLEVQAGSPFGVPDVFPGVELEELGEGLEEELEGLTE
jgi:hypothetical protein